MKHWKKNKCICHMLRNRRALLEWTEKKLGQQLCWLWQEQDLKGRRLGRGFVYEHPALRRQWLQQSPCEDCPCQARCDQICALRAAWWDARMGLLKDALGVKKG